jgi:copper homeostasis protein
MLEIIAFDLEGCKIAERAGADRIELCADPHLGGTTPSFDLIKQAKAICNIPIHVMIRPRGGGFCYNEIEVSEMESAIQVCKMHALEGVVFGVLQNDGYLDDDLNMKLISHCGDMSKTFHRAFDEIVHPFSSLEKIIALGFDRILTSGLHPTAEAGKDVIKKMIKQAEGRIIIMPGSGIKGENLKLLDDYLGAIDYHSSAKIIDSDANYIGVNQQEVASMKETLSHT